MISWLGLLLMVLLALWAVVNGTLLSSWAAQCWNLEKASGGGGTSAEQLLGAAVDASLVPETAL